MPIHCPKCGKNHDVIKFEAGHTLKCECGLLLDLSLLETVDDFMRYFENEDERKKAQEIQQDAMNICQLILDHKVEWVDIEIEAKKLEEKVAEFFPDKIQVYRMIYEARFKRLREQFRPDKND